MIGCPAGVTSRPWLLIGLLRAWRNGNAFFLFLLDVYDGYVTRSCPYWLVSGCMTFTDAHSTGSYLQRNVMREAPYWLMANETSLNIPPIGRQDKRRHGNRSPMAGRNRGRQWTRSSLAEREARRHLSRPSLVGGRSDVTLLDSHWLAGKETSRGRIAIGWGRVTTG